MERFESKDKLYEAFVDATELRIAEIGATKDRTIREAQHVQRQLFKATDGDAARVTDQMIEAEFDKLNG
jgi:vacuolar-type H+-ATPase subunit B/Vma2